MIAQPAPLTGEDRAILERIRVRWKYPLNHWYQYYDRCDAHLMLGAQNARVGHWGWIATGVLPTATGWAGGPLLSSQAIDRAAADNISYFA